MEMLLDISDQQAGGMYAPPGEDPGGMDGGGKHMRIMKTGEPCPCCGQAIPAMLPVDKRLLASIVAEGLAIQDAVRTVEHGVVEGQEAMTALTPPNEPLTLEQLREMDEPVWVACKPIEGGNGYWCLYKRGCIVTPAGSLYDVKEIQHWVFYRRPPEGGDSVEQDSLLTALRRLRVETGSLPCLGCGYDYHCSTKGCAILREAEQRIIRQAALIRRLQIERKQAREENPK